MNVHLRSLTSLRFVAAMLVLVFHLSVYANGLDPWGRIAAAGYVGVTFFFVLSGFVLTYSYNVGTPTLQFYRRRFARIYPVHLLFLVVAMTPLAAPPNWAALPLNFTLLQAWSGDDRVVRSFSGVSWSLSCEVFFYAVLPLVARVVAKVRRPLRLAGLLLFGAFVVGLALHRTDPAWGHRLFYFPAFRLVEFVVGCLAAVAMRQGWVPALRMRWACAGVVASYLAVLVLPSFVGHHVDGRWALTLTMVPSLVILISVCARVDLVGAPSTLQKGLFVSLGQWSYCIYMTHPVVIGLTLPLLASSQLLYALAGTLLVVMAVVGVSFVVHVACERPAERLLRGKGYRRVSSRIEEAAEGSTNLEPTRTHESAIGGASVALD